MVVLDTNIIIDHLRQNPHKQSKLDEISKQISPSMISLSTISVQELYMGLSTKEDEAEQLLLATIGPLKILPYTYDIAQLAGELIRDNEYLISFADAAIAATAILSNSQLITLNKKDFKGIKELVLNLEFA